MILLTLSGLCIVRALLPADLVVDEWDTGAAQFAAFYLTLLGVGLLQADEAARRFVCVAAAPAALLGVAILVTGAGYERAAGGALVAFAGGLFLALLGREASTGRAAAGVVLAAAGSLLFFPAEIAAARAPREEARRRLAEWKAAEPSFERKDVGVRVAPPEGWVVLRPGSPFVPPDSSDLVALLHDASGTRAVVRLDTELRGGESLDDALDRHLGLWRAREPELENGARADLRLGDVPARRVFVKWKREKVAWAGHLVAWKDASRTLVLATWYEAARLESALPEAEKAIAALAVSRPLAARIAAAAATAAGQMPQMTPATVELLVARRPEADAPSLFREGLATASLGFERLERDQVRDMGEINNVLYGRMSAADRVWMADYVRRVRSAQPTTPEEDARAMRAMAAAVGQLPEASRERLRAILHNAVAAALHG